MSIPKENGQSRTSKWGWGILIALSALVALNGVFWFYYGGRLSSFEQDTGVPLSEFKQAYPTVAEGIARQHRQVAIWYGAFGLLALGVAWEGFRHRSRWAWNLTWILVAAPAAVGVNVLAGGEGLFGFIMLGFAAVGLVGQLLARRGLAP